MVDLFARFRLTKYPVNSIGGQIYVDRKVRLWLDSFKGENCEKHTVREWEIYTKITNEGFEEDDSIPEPINYPRISIVVVLYNSSEWVKNLNSMFSNLEPWYFEVIVVDNGSRDQCLEGINLIGNKIKKIRKEHPLSFAAAVNEGIKAASGDLFLLINPDIWIPRSSLWSLINFYLQHPQAAAIAPKLMLMRTSGFINSIGNYVPYFRWGYDLGLGHLDLGQFDSIEKIPSACFATILIPREKWSEVGQLDEDYPMYYEDSDWCYRARGLGYAILLDGKARVYHSFNKHEGEGMGINSGKLSSVSYGRLRFVQKNAYGFSSLLFIMSYFLFDLLYISYSAIKFGFHKSNSSSIIYGWKKFLKKKGIQKSSYENNPFHEISDCGEKTPQVKMGMPKLKWKTLLHHLENKFS